MANAAVTLTPAGTAVDFSTTTLHGTNGTFLTNGVNALWAGDVNFNSGVKYSGSNNDFSLIGDQTNNHPGNAFSSSTYSYTAYEVFDVNMNGSIKSSGSDNDASIIFDNTMNRHPGNPFNSTTYTIVEQLP